LLVTAHDAPLTILKHHRDLYRSIRALMALAARTRIDHLTAVSPYLAKRWRREMRYRRDIDVVPNIVRTFEEASVPPHVSVPAGDLLLTAVADAGRRKNIELLLDAFQLVRLQQPNITLALAGRGLGGEEKLASTARRHGLTENVTFVGHVTRTEVASLLSITDIFVHPSLEEACPMSVLEAMATRVPVVSGHNAGGVPWVTADTGVSVDVRSATSLRDGILELVSDHCLRKDLGDRAHARAESIFSPSAVASQYELIYRRLLREA
jgi:glycosyltransferase involved in cell wall biosynthesis